MELVDIQDLKSWGSNAVPDGAADSLADSPTMEIYVFFSVYFIEAVILFSFRNYLTVDMVFAHKVSIAPEPHDLFSSFNHASKFYAKLQ